MNEVKKMLTVLATLPIFGEIACGSAADSGKDFPQITEMASRTTEHPDEMLMKYEKQIENLRKENAEMRRQFTSRENDAQSEIFRLKEKIQKQRENYSTISLERITLNNQIAKLNKENSELLQQLSLQENNDERQIILQEANAKLQREVEEKNSKLNEYKQRILDLNKIIKDLTKRGMPSPLKNSAAPAVHGTDNVPANSSDNRKSLPQLFLQKLQESSKKKTYEELLNENQELAQRVLNSDRLKTETELKNRSLQQKLEKLQQENEEVVEYGDETCQKIFKLQQECTRHKEEYENVVAQYQALARQNNMVEFQNKVQNDTIAANERTIADLKQILSETQTKVNTLETQKKDYENKNLDLKNKLAVAQNEARNIEGNTVSKYTGQINQFNTQLQQLQIRMLDFERENTRLQAELKTRENRVRNLEDKLTLQKNQKDKALQEVKRVMNKNGELTVQNKDLKSRNRGLSQRIQELLQRMQGV